MAPSTNKLPIGNENGVGATDGTTVRSSAELGSLVREQRKRLALKQLDVAGLGNTGNRFIVDLENGKPTLQLQKVLDVIDLLGLELVVRAKSGGLPMTANPTSLDVYYGNELTGTIHDTLPISFEYSGSWLDRPARLTIAAIPLGPGRNDSPLVQACFENLLPEGELRDHLSEQRKASTVFSLLLEVAGDTAGGFVIVPGGRLPAPAAYEPTSWEAIATRLKSGSSAALDIHGDDARISLAGAQDKTALPSSKTAFLSCRSELRHRRIS